MFENTDTGDYGCCCRFLDTGLHLAQSAAELRCGGLLVLISTLAMLSVRRDLLMFPV
jgi:hypothetical protein